MPPVIVDTSALLAFLDASEPDRDAVSEVLAVADVLVVSPYVVAELDYLVATRHGIDDELAVLDELAAGARDLAEFDDEGLRRAREVISSYRDQASAWRTHRSWCWLSGIGRSRSPVWTAGTSESFTRSTAAPSRCSRGWVDGGRAPFTETPFLGTSAVPVIS